jgi:putative acetyltransferase
VGEHGEAQLVQSFGASPFDARLEQPGADAATAPRARNRHAELAEPVPGRVDVQRADDRAVRDRDERALERPGCGTGLDVDGRLGRDAVALLGDCGKEPRESHAVAVERGTDHGRVWHGEILARRSGDSDTIGEVQAAIAIRTEQPADHDAIDAVVRAAFVDHPDEVALLVERIRASENFVPELTLVAEDASGVIAHVLVSWVGLEDGSHGRILDLGPVSVRPDRQNRGVGTSIVRETLSRAEAAGAPAVMVEGIPSYYPRFGFERASELGFAAPHASIPDAAFMVKRLPGYEAGIAGRVVYPEAFDHLDY